MWEEKNTIEVYYLDCNFHAHCLVLVLCLTPTMLLLDSKTDRMTDGRTDEQADVRTDGRTERKGSNNFETFYNRCWNLKNN